MFSLTLILFLKLDWPPTFAIKSCGLQTEFLASNSGNGVNVKSLLPCLKLNAHQLLRLRPKTQLRGQLFMRWVRGQSNSISHLYSWCAFSLMHKIKGRRVYSPFAELEGPKSQFGGHSRGQRQVKIAQPSSLMVLVQYQTI